MTDLILHHYDASPFTQRALRMLGVKKLAWRSAIMPMMPPKDDLVALTGGYRGTPVLQIGAELWVDSQLIARQLERVAPTPTLFPGGNAGLTLALVKWSDQFFRTGLKLVLGALAVLAWLIDFAASVIGAQRVGASPLALVGAAIGTVVGLFGGLIGLLFAPLAGAAIGEFIARRDALQAARVGLATWLGMLLAAVAKVAIAFMMLGIALAAWLF